MAVTRSSNPGTTNPSLKELRPDIRQALYGKPKKLKKRSIRALPLPNKLFRSRKHTAAPESGRLHEYGSEATHHQASRDAQDCEVSIASSHHHDPEIASLEKLYNSPTGKFRQIQKKPPNQKQELAGKNKQGPHSGKGFIRGPYKRYRKFIVPRELIPGTIIAKMGIKPSKWKEGKERKNAYKCGNCGEKLGSGHVCRFVSIREDYIEKFWDQLPTEVRELVRDKQAILKNPPDYESIRNHNVSL